MRFFVPFFLCLLALPARAEFIISSAIIEFTATGPAQQDIELISRSKDSDYIVAEVSEVINPGQPDESRRLVEDLSTGRLLVTPDKTILAGGARKVLRFVTLASPDAAEHIYRVAVKPVIKGVDNNATIGLKVLVGYEVLVIIRPAVPRIDYTAVRSCNKLNVTNRGNTNVLFQGGQQCTATDKCEPVPVARVYPGETTSVELPKAVPVTYTVWDGAATTTRTFD